MRASSFDFAGADSEITLTPSRRERGQEAISTEQEPRRFDSYADSFSQNFNTSTALPPCTLNCDLNRIRLQLFRTFRRAGRSCLLGEAVQLANLALEPLTSALTTQGAPNAYVQVERMLDGTP